MPTIAPSKLENLQEKQLEQLNPKIANAIKAIQAERSGREPIGWSDFSSHKKS